MQELAIGKTLTQILRPASLTRSPSAVVAVATLGVATALLVADPPAAVIVGGVGLVLAVFIWPRPFFYLLVIATPLAHIPGDIFPSSHYSSARDVLLGLLALACVVSALARRHIMVPWATITWTLLGFCAVVILYIPAGPNIGQALLGAKALIFYALLYFLAIAYVRSERQLRLIVVGMVAVSGIAAAYALFSYLVPQQFFPYNPDGLVGRIWDGKTRLHYSPFTYYFGQFVPILWLAAAFLFSRRPTLRVAALTLSGLEIALIGLSELRAAWIALIISAGLYAAWRRARALPVLAVGLAVAVIVVLGPQSLLDRVSITGTASDIGFTGRVAEIQAFWIPLIQQHPFGLGTGTFSGSASFAWQPVFGALDFSYAARGVTHNGYMEVLGEFGIIGLIVYLALITSVIWRITKNWRILKVPFIRGVNVILLGQILSYCAINFFVPATILFPVNVYFFFVMGLAAALPDIDSGSAEERNPSLTTMLRRSENRGHAPV